MRGAVPDASFRAPSTLRLPYWARGAATVLVEKPATLHPAALEPAPEDTQIFVGFQPHFAPGIAQLLHQAPEVRRAAVRLVCRRDLAYYQRWRTRYAKAGTGDPRSAPSNLALRQAPAFGRWSWGRSGRRRCDA
ncbi:hypothetical protein ABCR94_24670 [Streptomyces sp. 21So2-11]|uniref:hypothetical protein n=1 Tax=Streptomyces sp. 21So2-11 TaxID=3144408 RepID=UPI00321A76C5